MSKSVNVIPGLVLLSFLTVLQVSFRPLDENEGAQLARQYCGSCHLTPNPKSLPTPIWQLTVLPAMGSYLGIRYMGYDPYYKLKPEEVTLLKERHIFPEKPVVDDETWQKIVAYYVENSPAQSPLDSTRRYRSKPLSLFLVLNP